MFMSFSTFFFSCCLSSLSRQTCAKTLTVLWKRSTGAKQKNVNTFNISYKIFVCWQIQSYSAFFVQQCHIQLVMIGIHLGIHYKPPDPFYCTIEFPGCCHLGVVFDTLFLGIFRTTSHFFGLPGSHSILVVCTKPETFPELCCALWAL